MLTKHNFLLGASMTAVVVSAGLCVWWIVRIIAAEGLVRDTPPEALLLTLRVRGYAAGPAFRRCLRSPDKRVRMKSVWGLGELRDVSDVKDLAAILSDDVPAMREAAATALSKIGRRAAPFLVARIRRGDIPVNGERFAALLAEYGHAASAPALLYILRTGDTVARRNAVMALGRLGDPDAIGPLMAALERDSLDVKIAAARALGQLGAPEAVDLLSAATRGPDPALKANAAEALGLVGDTLAVGAIAACLQDADTGVIARAVEGLGRLGCAGGLDPLLRLVREKGRAWRLYHAEVVEAVDVCAQGMTAKLAPLATDGDPDVRSLAVGVLAASGDPGAFPALARAARGGLYEARKKAIAALGGFGVRSAPALLSLLDDTSVYIRRDAIRALSLFKDRRAAAALFAVARVAPTRQADDGTHLEWQEAALALGRMGERRVAPVLRNVVASRLGHADRSIAAEVLGMVKDSGAIACLIAALADSTADTVGRVIGVRRWDVRVGAAHALGAVGDRRCVAALTAALESRNPDLRAAAQDALSRIDGAASARPVDIAVNGPDGGDARHVTGAGSGE